MQYLIYGLIITLVTYALARHEFAGYEREIKNEFDLLKDEIKRLINGK